MDQNFHYAPDAELTIGDIATRQIIYFDKAFEDKCAEFCQVRDISMLPDLSVLRSIHKYDRDKHKFSHTFLPPNEFKQMTISPDRFLFADQTLAKFQKQDLLFVVDQDVLLGIVHYSDYNKSIVYEQTYHRLFKLERGLLQLIEMSGKFKRRNLYPKTTHMPDAPLTAWDFREEHKSLNEVLNFANDHKLISIQNVAAVKELRNRVAHSADLVLQKDYGKRDLVFEKESFVDVIKGQQALTSAIRVVYNKLYFLFLERSGFAGGSD